MRKIVLLIVLLCSLSLMGCNNDDNEKNSSDEKENNRNKIEQSDTSTKSVSKDGENESDNIQDESQDVFSDMPEYTFDKLGFINQRIGKYGGKEVDDFIEEVLEDLKKLPKLPENASQEELDLYFNYYYSLVAEDFPDPQDTIKKWEFGSFGSPDLPDSRFHFKDNYNVEILLDASGSMGAYIGNQTMMQIAKDSIHNFMKQVPEEANVSFRVYGHKGTGSNSDKQLSCESIEQVYGYAPYNEQEFLAKMNDIQPAGWTPLADALKQAEESLKQFDTKENTNLIYVVSDGIETCDGDPVAVAKSLADSNAKPIINIIGFNVDSDAQAQLREMAKVSGGVFTTANNQEELEAEFERAQAALEAWEDWKNDAIYDLKHIGVDNRFDTLGDYNDWSSKISSQFLNMSDIIYMAWDEGMITSGQRDILRSMLREVQDLQKQTRDEIREELNDLSADKIEEMKAEINKKYNEQTQN